MFGPGPISSSPWADWTLSIDPSNGYGTMFLAFLGLEGQTAEYSMSVGKKAFANLNCLCPCSDVLPLANF